MIVIKQEGQFRNSNYLRRLNTAGDNSQDGSLAEHSRNSSNFMNKRLKTRNEERNRFFKHHIDDSKVPLHLLNKKNLRLTLHRFGDKAMQ
jgi:hypothetical protein